MLPKQLKRLKCGIYAAVLAFIGLAFSRLVLPLKFGHVRPRRDVVLSQRRLQYEDVAAAGEGGFKNLAGAKMLISILPRRGSKWAAAEHERC